MKTSLAARHSLLIGAFVAITTLTIGGFVARETSRAKHEALV